MLILAGNYRQYTDYIKANYPDIQSMPFHARPKYLSSLDNMIGRTGGEVLVIGTGYLRDDYHQLIEEAEIRFMTIRRLP